MQVLQRQDLPAEEINEAVTYWCRHHKHAGAGRIPPGVVVRTERGLKSGPVGTTEVTVIKEELARSIRDDIVAGAEVLADEVLHLPGLPVRHLNAAGNAFYQEVLHVVGQGVGIEGHLLRIAQIK